MVDIKPQSVFLPPVKFYFLQNLSIHLFLLKLWDMWNMKLERSLAVANALIPLQIQRLFAFQKIALNFALLLLSEAAVLSAVLKQGQI